MRLSALPGRAVIYILVLICALCGLGLTSAAASAAEIGNQWSYTLIHEVEVENRGSGAARDITVEVPLPDAGGDYPYCRIIGTELTPYPDRIVTDADGRRVAVYNIRGLAAGQSLVLTQRYAMQVSSVTYPLSGAAQDAFYSAAELELLDEYLQPTAQIQSDSPAIAAFVRENVDRDASPYWAARSLFSAVNLALDYSTAAADQSAVATLMRRKGSCEGYVNLYLACLRAAGVACRQVSGYLYQPSIHDVEGYIDPVDGQVYLEQLRHTWAEFYLPGEGWLPADPTFTYTFLLDGVPTKFVNWNYFANVSMANRYICFRQGDTAADKIRLISATGGQVELGFAARLAAGHHYTPFSDIAGHWAEEHIRYCVENGLFSGMSPREFGPEVSMTRAMFVTVLGRLYENMNGSLPAAEDPVSFVDVPSGSYYARYLDWATGSGVVSGYGGGRFGPDDPVTREQMAAIMVNFLRAAGYDEALVPGSSDGFADGDDISAWAVNGVGACVGCGLLSGYPDGCFYPADHATRAQVATILQRLDRWIAGQGRD